MVAILKHVAYFGERVLANYISKACCGSWLGSQVHRWEFTFRVPLGLEVAHKGTLVLFNGTCLASSSSLGIHVTPYLLLDLI